MSACAASLVDRSVIRRPKPVIAKTNFPFSLLWNPLSDLHAEETLDLLELHLPVQKGTSRLTLLSDLLCVLYVTLKLHASAAGPLTYQLPYS